MERGIRLANTWVIASLTFRETIRRRALLGAVLLTLAFLALFAWGSGKAFDDLRENYGQNDQIFTLAVGEIMLAGLYGISNIGGLLAIFVAAGTIATEVEEGTLHAIVPRPLHRWEVVLGKWLGFALMVSIYVILTGLAATIIIYFQTGYLSPNLSQGLGLLALKTILLLTLSILFSSFLPALTAGIIVFILYAVSNVTGLVETFGHLIRNQTMIDIGIVSSLVVPSDALWKMAAATLQPPVGEGILASLRAATGPFSVLNPPSPWMAVYALAYIALLLGAALVVFEGRDL